MKKTLTFALIGVIMIAFASCKTKETKQFKKQKEDIQQIEEIMNTATNCDDLQMINLGILGLQLDSNEYADNEKMTTEEKAVIDDMIKGLNEKLEVRIGQLGCNNEDESDFEIGNEEDVEEEIEEEYTE